MAKPKLGNVQVGITMHPAVKGKVIEFAEKQSIEAREGKLKNMAVITHSYALFNIHRLSNEAVGDRQNFVHVSKLNDVYGIEWSDQICLDSKIKMPNKDIIIKEIDLIINKSSEK